MTKLSDRLRESPSRREPPYRPMMTIGAEERAELARKLGDAANYNNGQLRPMIAADPQNIELRKALVSGIMSAEFAGVDAFARKVVEWQEWPVPSTLIMAMARQTWDEVRHAQLAKGVLESYGGRLGEYPDTLAGGGGPQARLNGQQRTIAAQQYGGDVEMRDPVTSLSMTNVSLEGAALANFQATSVLGHKIGDQLLEHCYDYNWADEVTHTAIGDWFIKEIARQDPDAERRALLAHARHEAMRARLSGEQSEEIRAFFAEEDERAEFALSGGET